MKKALLLTVLFVIFLSACKPEAEQKKDDLPDYNSTIPSTTPIKSDTAETPSKTVEISFEGFGVAQSSGKYYNTNNICDISGRLENVGDTVYYAGSYNGNNNKLYEYKNGNKELLIDDEVRNLTFYENELYYIKKTANFGEGSVLFLGDIYAFNPVTTEERIVLGGKNIFQFAITEDGLFYATKDEIVWADMDGNTIKQLNNNMCTMYFYGDYILLYDKEAEERHFKNIHTDEIKIIDRFDAMSYILDNTMFLVDGNYFSELDLITGELHQYPEKSISYITYMGGDVYVTDMYRLYVLDRESFDYIELDVDINLESINSYSFFDLYAKDDKLFALISYQMQSDLFTSNAKFTEIVITGNKAKVIWYE